MQSIGQRVKSMLHEGMTEVTSIATCAVPFGNVSEIIAAASLLTAFAPLHLKS